MKWAIRIIFTAIVFIAGIILGFVYSSTFNYFRDGALDSQISHQSFFRALDGYISVPNRYVAQLFDENTVRAYRGIQDFGAIELGIHPSIYISPYIEEYYVENWFQHPDIETIFTIEKDELLENGMRRLYATAKDIDRSEIEYIIFIKNEKMIYFLCSKDTCIEDVKDFSKKIMDSYKELNFQKK